MRLGRFLPNLQMRPRKGRKTSLGRARSAEEGNGRMCEGVSKVVGRKEEVVVSRVAGRGYRSLGVADCYEVVMRLRVEVAVAGRRKEVRKEEEEQALGCNGLGCWGLLGGAGGNGLRGWGGLRAAGGLLGWLWGQWLLGGNGLLGGLRAGWGNGCWGAGWRDYGGRG
ncbi:hypothetical protein Hamer_G001307 [Homarus americanus]|uniref:Uncharacterized protein n=1 Tax=Homarus americanus TaxID=6706 RepID=A0A8J5N7M3_HOMAM|nr:hypothetical protein Hamer_G001307 [Homarus americanus]